MYTTEPTLTDHLPKAEFKDTPASIQYVEVGILAVGGLIACLLYTSANQNLYFYCGAGLTVISAVIAAVVVDKKYGRQTSLQHYTDRLLLADRGEMREIPFDQL